MIGCPEPVRPCASDPPSRERRVAESAPKESESWVETATVRTWSRPGIFSPFGSVAQM